MQLYRFSPIRTLDQIKQALRYVSSEGTKLGERAVGEQLSIDYLTLFAHYDGEYRGLVSQLKELGKDEPANHGIRIALHQPMIIETQSIALIKVRQPDPYRTQVGCCDFKVPDYQSFKNKYLFQAQANLRLIERPGYEMIEFFDPDFDVFAYVVSKKA